MARAVIDRKLESLRRCVARVKVSKWTQTGAAAHCGVTQPHISDLLRGRLSRSSFDALVDIATALGKRVHLALKVA